MGNNKPEGYTSAEQFGSRFKALLYEFTDLVIIGKQRKDQYKANGLSRKPVGAIRSIPKSPESPRRSGGI